MSKSAVTKSNRLTYEVADSKLQLQSLKTKDLLHQMIHLKWKGQETVEIDDIAVALIRHASVEFLATCFNSSTRGLLIPIVKEVDV